jgi:hypothetical protein
MLHLTKVAFGCDSVDDLTERLAARAEPVRLTTRYRPKRHEELIGGSLFWILKHKLVARSEITGFGEAPEGRTDILLTNRVILVHPKPKRAHQGWRYLTAGSAPRDVMDGEVTGDDLPPGLAIELSSMGLL